MCGHLATRCAIVLKSRFGVAKSARRQRGEERQARLPPATDRQALKTASTDT
jgi:hypothetical protein